MVICSAIHITVVVSRVAIAWLSQIATFRKTVASLEPRKEHLYQIN